MLTLYENIKHLRKKNKWTQEELAIRMGYTDRSTIAKIEAGKVDLQRSKIFEFAKVFGVSPSDLMGDDGTEDDTYDQLLKIYERNIKLKELIELYTNVPPDIQDTVINLLKATQMPKENNEIIHMVEGSDDLSG